MQMKNIINYRPMFYCFLALLGSILFAKYIFQSNWLLIAIFILIVICATTAFIISKKFIAGLFLLLSICVGIGGYALEMSAFSPEPFHSTSQLEGRVNGSSSTYGNNQYVILENVKVDGESISENVQLKLYGAPYLSVGDSEKENFTSKTINDGKDDGTRVEQVIAKYKYIVTKYGTQNFEDFIWGRSYNPTSQLSGVFNSNNDSTIIIVVIGVTATVIATGLYFALKKKHN